MHEALCPSPGTFQGFLVASSSVSSREFLISQLSTHDVHTSKDPRIPDSGLETRGPSRRTGGRSLVPSGSRGSCRLDDKRTESESMAWRLLYCTRGLSSNASVQFSSVAQSCPTLGDSMNRSMPGLPVHHQLLEFTQTQVHPVSDAIQPSHPLSSPSLLAPNPSQPQSLFQ